MCARSCSQVSKSLTWFKALKTRTFCIESSYNQEPSLNQNAFMCFGSSISIRNWVNYLKLYLTSIIINTSQIFTRAKFRTCSKTNFSKKFSHSTRFISNNIYNLWQWYIIVAGLSYINSTNYNIDSSISLKSLQNLTHGYKVRNIWFELICLNVKYWLTVGCVINVENWTKWLLGEPVYFFKYGSFLPSKHLGNMKQDHDESIQANFKITLCPNFVEFHSREIFPSHREVTIAVNTQTERFTGTSGIVNTSEVSSIWNTRDNGLETCRPQLSSHLDVEHPLQS